MVGEPKTLRNHIFLHLDHLHNAQQAFNTCAMLHTNTMACTECWSKFTLQFKVQLTEDMQANTELIPNTNTK